jgi:AcrR family transcriptional regulator
MSNSASKGVNRPSRAPQQEKGLPDLRLWKLPRGRHGLPSEIVAQSQRERLLAAVVRVTAAKGYQATSVAHVLELAGVGRESFYKHFKDKEACFLAANDALLDDLVVRTKAAYGEAGPWPERVVRGLLFALDWLAADVEVTQVMLIEMGRVGKGSAERFHEAFGLFVAIVDQDEDAAAAAAAAAAGGMLLVPNGSSIAVGGVFARVYDEVSAGNSADLAALLPSLSFELLLPYIGEKAAGKERRRATKLLAGR